MPTQPDNQEPEAYPGDETPFTDDVRGARLAARVEHLAALGDESARDILARLLLETDWDIDIVGPRIVAAGLVQHGQQGVDRLASLLGQPAKKPFKVASAILSTLWAAADGRRPWTWRLVDSTSMLWNVLPVEAQQRAQSALDNIAADATTDYDRFFDVIHFLSGEYDNAWVEDENDEEGRSQRRFATRFFDLITHATIRISPSLIDRLERLIVAEEREEEYQQFLADHPVFLDPLASEMIEKHRLGSEHVTDFVLRRHDGEYVLVEIEKPHDVMFTARNDFSAVFTHAYGQVLDFQQWVRDEIAYAQRQLPGISIPRGVLIIGRTATLSADNLKKLRAFRAANLSIDVLTYDDLIVRARNLYQSLRSPHGR